MNQESNRRGASVPRAVLAKSLSIRKMGFIYLSCMIGIDGSLAFPDQKAIAHIVGSLDDKVELNRGMNAMLEGMAQAHFKRWFVDIDPVIDHAPAAGNLIPDELAPRAKVRRQAFANGTANREAPKSFPAALQYTESMGWIPEGGEETSFSDHINFQTRPVFESKDFPESGARFARGDNVKEGRFQWADELPYWSTLNETLEKYLLRSGGCSVPSVILLE